MPVNRKWNIAALHRGVRQVPARQGRRVTFEYVLLRRRERHRRGRASGSRSCCAGIPAKVNLIPYNENPGLGFGDPGAARRRRSAASSPARGITAMVRKNRGRDIAAACGQLAVAGQQRE